MTALLINPWSLPLSEYFFFFRVFIFQNNRWDFIFHCYSYVYLLAAQYRKLHGRGGQLSCGSKTDHYLRVPWWRPVLAHWRSLTDARVLIVEDAVFRRLVRTRLDGQLGIFLRRYCVSRLLITESRTAAQSSRVALMWAVPRCILSFLSFIFVV